MDRAKNLHDSRLRLGQQLDGLASDGYLAQTPTIRLCIRAPTCLAIQGVPDND